jgi:hypothetical protein
MSAISRQSVAASVVALLCVVGLGVLQVPKLNALLSSQKTASAETLERETESEKLRLNFLAKLPAFGFDNLVADWVYLNFLQYFGDDEVRAKTGYRLSPEYFEVILERDPRFLPAYLSLSTSTSMYAGMPERSVGLMEKGLKFLSPTAPAKSYYVWRYKGIDELLFLGDEQAAQKSFETAAKWASNYSDEESKQIAAISQGTAQFIASNPNSKLSQVSAWSMVLSSAVDDKTRQRAIAEIEALGGQIVNTPQGYAIKPPKEEVTKGTNNSSKN